MRNKADELLQMMIDGGELKEFPCCCDSSLNNPHVRDVSNVITTRYDAGIQNFAQIGLCVIEGEEMATVDSNDLKEVPSRLRETLEGKEIDDGDYIDTYNRNIKKGVAGTITTRTNASNNTFIAEKQEKTKKYWKLRIRKLHPKETFRLQGVPDEYFERIQDRFCKGDLYHLCGDSICVDVLIHQFSMFFDGIKLPSNMVSKTDYQK